MATANPNLPAFFNTDAEFRTWAQAFHDILNNGGWVNTADTGQINLSTVVKPAAINTSQGYEIWRMADAAQATAPIFLKLEYGSGGAVDRPSWWITIGSGSNGAGTLTGQVGSRQQIAVGNSKTAGVTLPAYLSAGTNRFSFVSNLDIASANFHMVAVVERTADATGTVTTDGCLTYYNTSGGQYHQVVASTGAIPTGGTSPLSMPLFHPSGSADNTGHQTVFSNNVAMVPAISLLGQPFFWRSMLTYRQADIGDRVAITVVEPDGSHTFMPFGIAGLSISDQASVNCGFATIWE